MFETIRNAWKIVDLRKRLIYTFVLLVIFRLGSTIPVPLLKPEQMQALFTAENSMFANASNKQFKGYQHRNGLNKNQLPPV